MKFCEKCDNLLDFCIKKETQVPFYKCSRCTNITEFKLDEHKLTINLDEKIKLDEILNTNGFFSNDPTIPNIKNKSIKCINTECSSIETGNNEIKYIKYNDSDMKYIYICNTCGQKWTN